MIISGMPNEVYHAHDSVSKSQLDLLNRSPAHLRFAPSRETTRAMEIGTAIHSALLEPDRFTSDYMLLKDVDDRRASAYKEAIKIHPSDRVLTRSESDNVAGMMESVYANHEARKRLEASGHRELSFFAKDPETGVSCRCRFDIITDELDVFDLKKTRDARPRQFGRSVFDYRYHVQEAFYRDVFFWAAGLRLREFRFLAIEDFAPYACKIYQIDDEMRMYAGAEYRADLNRYAECLASSDWPAYPADDDLIGLPGWLVNDIENNNEVTYD